MSEANATGPEQDHFEVGGEELFVPPRGPGALEESAGPDRRETLDDIRIRVGTLLKGETVSFLLGAGASFNCGGQLIGDVPLFVERELLNRAITGTRRIMRRWLPVFYLAVRHAGGDEATPVTRGEILARRELLTTDTPEPLRVNLEQVLALLHRWRSALPGTSCRLRVDGSPAVDATADELDAAISHTTRALSRACDLPVKGKESGLATHRTLIRKILTRPLNLKRVNLFTLNYDTLIEQAADAEGVVLLDGFVGSQRRVFRPESYDQDLYFPAETTEGRVHRFDRVLHLYKLHGSITWTANEPTTDDPYGVQSARFDPGGTQPLLIYPTPAKYGETLGLPYSELFRRFAVELARPQSVLFVTGYGFGDEHVNAIIRQAMAVPSFTIVVVDPSPKSDFVDKLRKQNDTRVWIATGSTLGTLTGFVDEVLPDLRDEEIRKKVVATHRALAETRPEQGNVVDDE